MYKGDLIEKLKLICSRDVVCRIERNGIDEFKKSCKPISFNDEFLLICYEYDFEFDGFEIIRLDDITNIIYDDVDIFINDILIKENIKPIIDSCLNININSYFDIMKFFFQNNENLIIECERQGEFYIGKIIEISQKCISFLNFDGEGVWEEEPSYIFYNDITLISFRNRYVRYMSKYAHRQGDGSIALI